MPTSPRQAANRLRAERGGTPTRGWQVCFLRPPHVATKYLEEVCSPTDLFRAKALSS